MDPKGEMTPRIYDRIALGKACFVSKYAISHLHSVVQIMKAQETNHKGDEIEKEKKKGDTKKMKY